MTVLEEKPFLTPDDFKDDEEFVFMDEGSYEEVNFGTEEQPDIRKVFRITISLHEQEFLYSMNKTSILSFMRSYGKDTKKWIGKRGTLTKLKQLVFGKKKDVTYGTPITVKK